MTRSSRTGGKTSEANARNASPAKGRKTTKTKRRIPPAATRVKRSVSYPSKDLKEARRQQAATAEILKIIASSPDDVQPVLEAVAERALSLLDAWSVLVTQFDGELLHFGAARGALPDTEQFLRNQYPMRPEAAVFAGRCILERAAINISDARTDPSPQNRERARRRGFRAALSVPMLRDGQPIGVITISRSGAGAFAANEVELLQTFADQAVIAIENTRLFNEVQAKTRELTESLQQQTATGDVLKVIASSPTNVEPVLQAIVESACAFCGAYDAGVVLKIGEDLHFSAHYGPIPPGQQPRPINRQWVTGRSVMDKVPVQVSDFQAPEAAEFPEGQRQSREQGVRCTLSVPLLREGEAIGAVVLRRLEPVAFTDKQIALLQTFADQAVIAIENARLFNETKEALERQTATAEILKVIASSPSDVQPVFDVIVQRAVQLCGARMGRVYRYDGNLIHLVGGHGLSVPGREGAQRPFPRPAADDTIVGRVMLSRRPNILADLNEDKTVPPLSRQMIEALGARSQVTMPMLLAGEPIGAITLSWAESSGYNDHQIALLQTFADQAVIAIENVRLFNETKEALERQTATADILKVIASSPSNVQPVFDAIAERSKRLVDALSTTVFRIADGIMHLTAFTSTNPGADAALKAMFPAPLSGFSWSKAISKGDIYRVVDTEHEIETLRDLARLRGYRSMLFVPLLRDKQPIGVIAVTRVEPGPFVEHHVHLLQTFADQAVIAISNVQLFQQLQESTRELSASLDDLRTAQDRLVQTEKLASLGQLTAGIAHEIKNPLNFVNNFSALSAELTVELNDALKPVAMEGKVRGEVDELTRLLKDNLEKVVQHGKRADSIVKNMLLHSREGSGEHRPADINSLLDESLNLAYHGARAEKGEFNITLQRDFDADAGTLELFPQEITRAFLNLISNGVYAAAKRKKENGEPAFEPMLTATTKNLGSAVEIRIRDNGTGIPAEVREKMFNPFFTTKPAGEGTGLGLSMTHDIIVKQHGGRIDVATEPGQFTEFIIVLPRKSAVSSKDRGET